MTIESGPPLRLAPNPANPTRSIASEFGDSTPRRLSNYLRGGGLVPDIPNNSKIPTSLPIRFSDFYGSMNIQVLLFDQIIQDESFGASSVAAVQFRINGQLRARTSDGIETRGTQWINGAPVPGGVAGSFQIRMVRTDAEPNVGDVEYADGTWRTLNDNIEVGIQTSLPGPVINTILQTSIRAVGTTDILATAAIQCRTSP